MVQSRSTIVFASVKLAKPKQVNEDGGRDCSPHYRFSLIASLFNSVGCILSVLFFFFQTHSTTTTFASLHLTCALLGSILLSPALTAPSRSSLPAFYVSFFYLVSVFNALAVETTSCIQYCCCYLPSLNAIPYQRKTGTA